MTPPFRPRAASPAAAVLLLAAVVFPAASQERFGAAVAVRGPEEVVVLKPGALRGPAAALVFQAGTDGAWRRSARLPALAGAFPGEGLTPSLAVGGGLVLMGGGDPDGALAGHLYRAGEGGWTPVGRIPADPAVPPASGLPASGLDMATLMSLMEPAPRVVALSPDGRRMAVSGGGVGKGAVHVLRRADGDAASWTLEAVLREGGSNGAGGADAGDGRDTGFGVALDLADDRLLVGAPDAPPGGAAHLFQRADGAWRRVAVLAADSLEAGGRLGAAVALGVGEVWVGAPERGRVIRFASAGGRWGRAGELGPVGPGDPAVGGGTGFGAALAADGDLLLVGAPRARNGRGAVHRFAREDGGSWRAGATLAPEGLARGDGFGAALDLSGRLAVAGAPDADGGRGRAGLFDPTSGGLTAWLDPGLELDAVVDGEVRCAEGDAAGFACDGVDLLAFLPLSALGAGPEEQVSDVWGWTDPQTGREYALVGRTAGLAFVDITAPAAPRFLGLLPANPSHARDIKVYRDHAFLTGDGAGDHGLLVFDLTRLREIAEVPATFEPDARYDQVASAHNLVIDTESGFAYTVGTNTGGQSCGGGLHMIDIRDPLTPTFAGCYTDTEGLIWAGRTHDAQCTVYRGPDAAYRGRQICFAANETALRIVDVTDKDAPVPLASASHPGTAYVHQGWLTEDQRYFYVNDELDEIVGTTARTRTLVWDVAELEDPILVAEHLGPDQATDHNLYIAGDRAYLANYQAGFRVLDISDPEHPVEVGWFDTTPYADNPPGFLGGAWTAFPFFESGTVVVSSINEGLFLLAPRPAVLP